MMLVNAESNLATVDKAVEYILAQPDGKYYNPREFEHRLTR